MKEQFETESANNKAKALKSAIISQNDTNHQQAGKKRGYTHV